MAKEPRLRERDWKHETYAREKRLRILRHKITPLVTEDKRSLSLVEDRMIYSASVLIVSLFEKEKAFAAEPSEDLSKDYLPMAKELRSVLGQLGLSLNGRKKEGGEFDLGSLLSSGA